MILRLVGAWIVGALMMGCASGAPQISSNQPGPFVLEMPANWAKAGRIHLLLEDVKLPGNQPIKLRVTVAEKGRDIFLAGAGFPAISPAETNQQHLPSVQFDVTRALKEKVGSQTDRSKVELRVTAVDGRNNPLKEVKWSFGKARLEIISSSLSGN